MTRPFTMECLACVQMLAAAGTDLTAAARTLGRPVDEIDQARWALVGRSIPAALATLNRPREVTT